MASHYVHTVSVVNVLCVHELRSRRVKMKRYSMLKQWRDSSIERKIFCSYKLFTDIFNPKNTKRGFDTLTIKCYTSNFCIFGFMITMNTKNNLNTSPEALRMLFFSVIWKKLIKHLVFFDEKKFHCTSPQCGSPQFMVTLFNKYSGLK